MRRIAVLQLVIVFVISAVCSTAVPAAEKAPKACCAKAAECGKPGLLHLKVDFTVASSKDNPKPIPGTTKEGWWQWIIPDWDQYRADLKWEDGTGKYPKGKPGIAGSGVHASITNHYEGLLTVSVAGMRRYLAGGIQPINKPIDDPICNTWVAASDFPSNPSSDLLLSFYDLPAGKYRLKSYHNNYNGRRVGDGPTGVEYDQQRQPEPPMPTIKVYPMKTILKDYFKRTDDATIKGKSYGTPEDKMIVPGKVGTGNVKQTLEAKDVVIQQVTSDAKLKPSVIEFTTDGSPLLVVYAGGCCKKDDLRKGREGGFAILNAFELIQLPHSKVCSDGKNDWPGFRGADRTGISKEKGLLKKWPEGGPKETWSVKGLGGGFASVAVANGLIYTTGMDKNKQGILSAFDLDGKPVWSQQYGPEWKDSHRGTRTTPTVDGDRLYIMSGQGRLACYDAKSGKPKWYIDTLEKFKGKNIKWGISESVLIDGKKLICTPGGKNASVVALDKMTGETIWTSKDLSGLSAYCCPVIHQIGNNRVLITMLAKSIVALNPENGDLYWQVPHEVSHNIQAVIPVYYNNMLYVSNGYGKGGKMLELSNDGTACKEKWTDKNLDCHHGGVVLIDGDIHGSNHKGSGQKGWVRLDWETGKVKVVEKLVGKGSVIYADSLLYCYGEKGKLGLVKVTDTGYELVSSFEITKGEEEHWAHPAISNKVLYIRHGDVLMAFDIKGS